MKTIKILRPALLLFAFFLTISIVSCKSETPPKSEAKKSAQTQAPDGDGLTMIEQGKEPRRLLRYSAVVGQRESGFMIMNQELEMIMGGENRSAIYPPIRSPFEIVVLGVDDAGNIELKTTYGKYEILNDPGFDPQKIEELRRQYEKLEGVSCTTTITPRGEVTKGECEVAEGADQKLVQMIENLLGGIKDSFIYYPEKPVGAGAKWELKTDRLMSDIIKSHIEAAYSVEEISEKSVTIKSEYKQTAGEQDYALPNVATKATLKSLISSGSGMTTVEYDRLFPTGIAETEMTSVLLIGNPADENGPPSEVTTRMKMEMEFESKRVEAEK